MPMYLDLLPIELQEKIYKYVFDDCLKQVCDNHKERIKQFNFKYSCCNNITYRDFVNGCFRNIYPNKFLFSCENCLKPMCYSCWLTSHSYSTKKWCVLCIWSNLYP